MSISIVGSSDGPTSVYLAGKIGNMFFIPAVFILALFYSIYFIKQITAGRKGIQIRQLGKGKEKSVRITELILSMATFFIVPVQLVSVFSDWNFMPTPVRIAGIAAGTVGDLIFFAAVLTMKNSWRAGIPAQDKTEFVSGGIYRYSRNPAFLGFDLMYVGILLMYFNWLLILFTVWACVMLHIQMSAARTY